MLRVVLLNDVKSVVKDRLIKYIRSQQNQGKKYMLVDAAFPPHAVEQNPDTELAVYFIDLTKPYSNIMEELDQLKLKKQEYLLKSDTKICVVGIYKTIGEFDELQLDAFNNLFNAYYENQYSVLLTSGRDKPLTLLERIMDLSINTPDSIQKITNLALQRNVSDEYIRRLKENEGFDDETQQLLKSCSFKLEADNKKQKKLNPYFDLQQLSLTLQFILLHLDIETRKKIADETLVLLENLKAHPSNLEEKIKEFDANCKKILNGHYPELIHLSERILSYLFTITVTVLITIIGFNLGLAAGLWMGPGAFITAFWGAGLANEVAVTVIAFGAAAGIGTYLLTNSLFKSKKEQIINVLDSISDEATQIHSDYLSHAVNEDESIIDNTQHNSL